jgi:Na+-transporting NADH:ubiquinone oxidoreductase subunit A
MMEQLGIYECDPEDFALCSFADASKMDIISIVQEGLNYAEVEG